MSYEELSIDELKPGVLCTILAGKKRKMRPRMMGDVIAMPIDHQEQVSPLAGWPLRVKHFEPETPYIVLEILDAQGRPHNMPARSLMDVRKVTFCRISQEYRRQVLGESYQSTL